MSTRSNNSNNSSPMVTRVVTTPKQKSVKNSMIDVRISMDEYKRFKDYKKYIKAKNIEIPSGQSEYSQRLANLDIKYNRLKQLYKNLINLYNNLYKECKENNKITKYGKRKRTTHKRQKYRTESETNDLFFSGLNTMVIGNAIG